METLAFILFYIVLLSIITDIVLIIYSLIKKNFKLRPKKLLIVLLCLFVCFIGSIVFYGAVESPETKAKLEAAKQAKIDKKESEEKVKASVDEKAIDEIVTDEKTTDEDTELPAVEENVESPVIEEPTVQAASDDVKPKDQSENKTTIIAIAQGAVEENLKSPKSADFPWGTDNYQITEGDVVDDGYKCYTIKGYVDAKNSFGAEIRSNFTVVLEITDNLETYKILSCNIK